MTEKGRAKFSETLDQAATMGMEIYQTGNRNPMLYLYLLSCFKGLGMDKANYMALASEALIENPSFYPIHKTAVDGILPKWGGSYDMVNGFVEWLSEGKDVNVGNDIYYRMVSMILPTDEHTSFVYYGFDWQKIKSSFQAYTEKHFATERDYHNMAMMAALHNQPKDTAEYFSQTSEQWNHFSKATWGSKDLMLRFGEWSQEKQNIDFANLVASITSVKIPDSDFKTLVDHFIANQGDINKTDLYGNSLLHYAVSYNQTNLLALLLLAGADPNQYDTDGFSGLHLAAQKNLIEVTKLLVEDNKTELSLGVKNNGTTAAHYAAINGFDELLMLLLNQEPALLSYQDRAGDTPLHEAARNGHNLVVRRVLNYPSAPMNKANYQGNSSLHLAVQFGHLEIVKQLVAKTADLQLLNHLNQAPLNVAQEQNYQAIADYLIQQGAVASDRVISLADRNRIDSYYQKASNHFNKNDYPKAIEYYKKILQIQPNHVSSHHYIAVLYFQYDGKLALAEQHINKALALNPGWPDSYYIAGRIYYAMNKPEKYTPIFKQFVRMDPDSYNAQDIFRNFSHVLGDAQGNTEVIDKAKESNILYANGVIPKLKTQPFTASMPLKYYLFLIDGLILLLLLWLLVKIRQRPSFFKK